jgi:hypothetical protein
MSFSFTELNTFGNQTITFTDNRPANVVFDWPTARDIDTTVLAGTFTAQRKINIVEIIQPATANVEYHIDVSAVSGTTISWGSLPSGVTVNEVSGVYIVSGIDSVDDWTAVAAPSITTPATFQGSFIYTSSIKYTTTAGRQTVSWNVGTFIPVSKMATAASLSVTAARFRDPTPSLLAPFNISATLEETGLSASSATDWLASTTQNITNNPVVTYTEDDGSSWTVTLTGNVITSISTLSSSGTGGTSSFDSGTKTLTLTGTITQVNSHLNSISYTATSTKQDFTFQYTAESTAQSTGQFTRNQPANCLNLDYLGPLRGSPTYTTAVETTIGGSLPLISDPDYTADGVYTYTVTPNNPGQVSSMSDSGVVRYWEDNVGNLSRNVSAVTGVSYDGEYLFTWSGGAGVNVHQKNNDDEWTEVQRIFNTTYDQTGFGKYLAVAKNANVFVASESSNTNDFNSGDEGQSNEFTYAVFEENATNDGFNIRQHFNVNNSQNYDEYKANFMAISDDGAVFAINSFFDFNENQAIDSEDGQDSEEQELISVYIWNGTTYTKLINVFAVDSDLHAASSYDDPLYYNFALNSDGTKLATYHESGEVRIYTLDITVTTIYAIHADDTSDWIVLTAPSGATSEFGTTLEWNNDILYVGDPGAGTNRGRITSYSDTGTVIDNATFTSAASQRLGDSNLGTLFNMDVITANKKIKFNGAGTQFTSMGYVFDVDASGNMTRNTDVPKVDDNMTPTEIDDKFITFDSGTTNLYEYYEHADPQPYENDELEITGTKTQLNGIIDNITLTSASGETGNISLIVDVVTPEANTEEKTITVTNTGS